MAYLPCSLPLMKIDVMISWRIQWESSILDTLLTGPDDVIGYAIYWWTKKWIESSSPSDSVLHLRWQGPSMESDPGPHCLLLNHFSDSDKASASSPGGRKNILVLFSAHPPIHSFLKWFLHNWRTILQSDFTVITLWSWKVGNVIWVWFVYIISSKKGSAELSSLTPSVIFFLRRLVYTIDSPGISTNHLTFSYFLLL